MKSVKRWFRDFFDPQEFNDMDTEAIASAFNDASVRRIWLSMCFEELKRINMEVDRRLLSGTDLQLTDLCARRKAYQDVLDSVMAARRHVTQGQRPNPRPEATVNLDRVTA